MHVYVCLFDFTTRSTAVGSACAVPVLISEKMSHNVRKMSGNQQNHLSAGEKKHPVTSMVRA